MSRPDLQNACDSLEARLPELLETSPNEEQFWSAFDKASEYIECLAVDREDGAYVRMRLEAMLSKHGINRV